jgi:hypothetical protein
MPHPDPHDPHTTIAGSAKRFASRMPDIDHKILRLFEEYVHRKVEKHFVPLAPDTDCSIETWLANTTYPETRKRQLVESYDRAGGRECITNLRDRRNSKLYYKLKCFMKDECYPEWKHARAINSRSDEFKCLVGPIFKHIDNALFSRKEFIKKVPVELRPEVMLQDLFIIGESTDPTDYSKYEATFVRVLMRINNWFNCYMTQHLPDGGWFAEVLEESLEGVNVCRFRDFIIEVEAKRMSGEMNTSSGNGFMNWMFVKFWAHMKNLKVVTKIEGDDGNPLFLPKLPTQKVEKPTASDFAKLGAEIKITPAECIDEAGFCGLVFDSTDRRNVTDPRDVLASFGFASAKYKNATKSTRLTLIRCKALSFAYQYPGTPIISALARYGLRISRSYDVRHMVKNWTNTWEREQMIEALAHPILDAQVGYNTRCLVEKLFHIPVDVQRDIEAYLDSLDTVQVLSCTAIDMIMPPVWKEYFDRYAGDEATDYPSQHFTQVRDPWQPFPMKGRLR